MPSKRTIVVLILCVAVVSSVFIYNKYNISDQIKNIGQIGVSNSRENVDVSYDWKKILTENSSTSVAWMKTTENIEETTLTDQVAKDFFSQFLVLKKANGEITEADALTIAKNTLSSPEFTKIQGAQYVEGNLHISNTVNKEIVQNYYNSMGNIAGIWKNRKIAEEFTITKNAINSGRESDLTKLDPIIADYKKIIVKLLEITVPADAKQIHLELLNNTSNVLFSVEAMRATFSDPIKGLLGMDRYETYMINLAYSVQKLQIYFNLKNVSK